MYHRDTTPNERHHLRCEMTGAPLGLVELHGESVSRGLRQAHAHWLFTIAALRGLVVELLHSELSLPALAWVHWVQLVGTSAMVLVGYCPLVRMLTLLPWNRSEAISRPWLRNLAFAPARGGLWDWSVGASPAPAACSCSVRWAAEPAQSP